VAHEKWLSKMPKLPRQGEPVPERVRNRKCLGKLRPVNARVDHFVEECVGIIMKTFYILRWQARARHFSRYPNQAPALPRRRFVENSSLQSWGLFLLHDGRYPGPRRKLLPFRSQVVHHFACSWTNGSAAVKNSNLRDTANFSTSLTLSRR